jgi:hypothetical protein
MWSGAGHYGGTAEYPQVPQAANKKVTLMLSRATGYLTHLGATAGILLRRAAPDAAACSVTFRFESAGDFGTACFLSLARTECRRSKDDRITGWQWSWYTAILRVTRSGSR